MLKLTGLATVNSVSYWSRATFTELGGRVYITESSQKSLDNTKHGGDTRLAWARDEG